MKPASEPHELEQVIEIGIYGNEAHGPYAPESPVPFPKMCIPRSHHKLWGW